MKTTLKKIAFYTLAILLGGCVPSLHPLFTDEEIIFDANLVGVWSEPNSKNFWEFKQADNKKYDVIYTDEKGIGKFDGRLGKIGGDTFIDFYPQDINLPGSDFYKFHLLGIHTFAKVGLSKDSLKLSVMNPDNVEKLLKTDPNATKHEKVDDRIVLISSTKELQTFIKKYGKDNDLFKEENDNQLQRVKQQDANSVK
ncbi:MAG TPA: hypothetical protein DDW84_04355 [Phycisphaerales bacterium]|nr:MAG: hypothetical protein A2Y13_11995 [Planctomycetes bacterium GWC2_45_44]HBG78068.1 hypothetical protein [Phycisphaerales bacterium]HBR20102.1 hypothetical protein [Phycisphaerales bacterium]